MDVEPLVGSKAKQEGYRPVSDLWPVRRPPSDCFACRTRNQADPPPAGPPTWRQIDTEGFEDR